MKCKRFGMVPSYFSIFEQKTNVQSVFCENCSKEAFFRKKY